LLGSSGQPDEVLGVATSTVPIVRRAVMVLLVGAVLLSACGGGKADVRPATALASDAFAITATSVDGSPVDLRTYAGRDVVVWFWAPW
jgi:hypothetical protein